MLPICDWIYENRHNSARTVIQFFAGHESYIPVLSRHIIHRATYGTGSDFTGIMFVPLGDTTSTLCPSVCFHEHTMAAFLFNVWKNLPLAPHPLPPHPLPPLPVCKHFTMLRVSRIKRLYLYEMQSITHVHI